MMFSPLSCVILSDAKDLVSASGALGAGATVDADEIIRRSAPQDDERGAG